MCGVVNPGRSEARRRIKNTQVKESHKYLSTVALLTDQITLPEYIHWYGIFPSSNIDRQLLKYSYKRHIRMPS